MSKQGNSRIGSLCRALVAAVVLSVPVATSSFGDYPKPAPVPYRWELEFEPGQLRLFNGASDGLPYWYFTYTVTNRTGEEQLWAPKFVLFTDTGEIIESGRSVPTAVTEQVLAVLGNDLLEDQNEIIGDILTGRENAREGLVIWPAKRLDVNELSLFIAGLSGETARVKNPVNGEEVILRKTLQRDYLIPGNAIDRGGQPVDLVGQQWVLR